MSNQPTKNSVFPKEYLTPRMDVYRFDLDESVATDHVIGSHGNEEHYRHLLPDDLRVCN